MGSREFLANAAKKIVRIVPGIADYQDKEKLRDLDKRLRNHIASLLTQERDRINDLKTILADEHTLDPLDDLDRLTKKISQLADTIQFAAYGYSPLFDRAAINQKKLEELYTFDKYLEKGLSQIIDAVNNLLQSTDAKHSSLIREVELSLATLEEKLKRREDFLKQAE